MTGIAGCCAREASGHSATAPPTNAMNSRRFIRSPRRRGRGQVLANLRQELTWAVGLGNVGVATRGTGLAVIPGQRIGGDDDDRNGMQRRVGLDSARRLVAVDARELDIHEYQVRLVLRR